MLIPSMSAMVFLTICFYFKECSAFCRECTAISQNCTSCYVTSDNDNGDNYAVLLSYFDLEYTIGYCVEECP